MTFCRRALLCAIAAVLAVAAPTVHAASDTAAARNMLNRELGPSLTLAKASIDQTAGAVKSAVAQNIGMATSILEAAIMAKEPKQGHGRLPCKDIEKLTRAAIASDSGDASKLLEMASSLAPECADTLNALLTNPETGDAAGLYGPAEDFGFGIGFGPGFPGSPGFVGSAPSGAIALPPVSNPITNVTGR